MRTLLLMSLLLASCGGKGKSSNVRIAIGPGLQMWCLPVSLTQSLGYYKDENLNVSIEYMPTRSTHALIGGSVDVSAATYDGNIVLAAEGQHVTSFFIMTNRDGKVLVVAPKASERIHRPEDLKGAIIGLASPGSGTNR